MDILGVAINPLAVGLSAVVSFAIGVVWYGVIFRDMWVRAQGFSDETIKSMQSGQIGSAMPMIVSFVGALVTASVMSMILKSLHIVEISEALSTAFFLWLAFPGAIGLMNTLYGMRSITGFIIDASYDLVYILSMAAIIVWLP